MTDETTENPRDDELEDTPETDESTERPNREARYRLRLREAEAERDALAGRLTRLQHAEAERLAGEQLTDGADLWRDGATLTDLLDDDGDLDPGKVREAAEALVQAHPHWRRGAHRVRPGALLSGSASPGVPERKEPLVEALSSARHRRTR